MTARASLLHRLSKCPGSFSMTGDAIAPLHDAMLRWQHSKAQFPEMTLDLRDASPAETGVDLELWATGAIAGAWPLRYAGEDVIQDSLNPGEHCEECPAKSRCGIWAASRFAMA